jgi:hypothetical protein
MVAIPREQRKVVTPGRIKVTRALLTFCRHHHHSQTYVARLEACLDALEKRDLARVSEHVRSLSHAGMGSFMDWVPPVAFEHEDQDYVESVWNALLGHWLESMRVFCDAEA